jgi:geranyl-CoA carboxylase alpha subunit
MRVVAQPDAVSVTLDGVTTAFRHVAVDAREHTLSLDHDGLRLRHCALFDGGTLHLAHGAAVFAFGEPSPFPAAGRADDGLQLRAPVAGSIAAVSVTVGEHVDEGQPLVCVEAMKMEMWLHARRAGRVTAVHAAPRDSVAAGALLIELDDHHEEPTP